MKIEKFGKNQIKYWDKESKIWFYGKNKQEILLKLELLNWYKIERKKLGLVYPV